MFDRSPLTSTRNLALQINDLWGFFVDSRLRIFKAGWNEAQSQDQKAGPAESLTIDPATIQKYKEAFAHDTTSYDKKFVASLGSILQRFNGKKLDTMVLTVGLDLVRTRRPHDFALSTLIGGNEISFVP